MTTRMRLRGARRRFSILIVMLAWPAASWAATTEERLRSVFDELQARPVACPAGLAAFGVASEARCSRIEGEFRTVRRAVERQFEPTGWPLEGWSRSGGYRARVVPDSSQLIVVLFQPEQRILAVVPLRPCPVDPAVHVPDRDGYEQPRQIEGQPPEIPDGVEGAAILRVVVGEDGRVRDPCVLHAEPQGRGFDELAVRAALRWRYEPARLDGKPVPVYVLLSFSWSTHAGP